MELLTMEKNFIIIFLTLIFTLIPILILKWIMEIVMVYIEKLINFITYKYILKLKFRYLLVFCEINILIIPFFLLIIFRKRLRIFSYLYIFLFLFIWGSITFYIRKERKNTFSLIDNIANKININNYFINRINLLFKQGSSMMILIVVFEFTILAFTELEWPMFLQYIAFLVLPIYLNIWIYLTHKLKLKDDYTINIRRIIVYILLVVYVLGDSYYKFYSILYYNTSPKLDLSNLFVYIASVFFIALERVIKLIIDDFKSFKKRDQINENN
ncbi:hypothetical protein [Clostridium tyrobutyricum]|uniref:hypothetical protein n=1 Tax=Clostridium tyrobutyricum TaxID=1519 RepID=UPI001C38DD83|nr:hypothetical protein [Clostridium tyrobutyricum]MBV4427346.1 hypothetical protein [Clostridium tyrobutyricum]MBV4442319.1 hypothetical protein [Clostridium tyrobutyricum]